MGKEEAAEVIGDSLIPVINKLQDIFSQVGPPGHVRDADDAPLYLAAPKAAAAGVHRAEQSVTPLSSPAAVYYTSASPHSSVSLCTVQPCISPMRVDRNSTQSGARLAVAWMWGGLEQSMRHWTAMHTLTTVAGAAATTGIC